VSREAFIDYVRKALASINHMLDEIKIGTQVVGNANRISGYSIEDIIVKPISPMNDLVSLSLEDSKLVGSLNRLPIGEVIGISLLEEIDEDDKSYFHILSNSMLNIDEKNVSIDYDTRDNLIEYRLHLCYMVD
jgi:hypothetical protein